MFDCGRCESSFSFSLLTDPCRGRRDFIESLLQASSPFIRPLLTPTHTFQFQHLPFDTTFLKATTSPPPTKRESGGKKTSFPEQIDRFGP